MPGGGIGGIIGGLVGGMGGPGGGMGGMGGPGGMGGMPGMGRMGNLNGQNQMNAGNVQSYEADVYDVDRWKRADGMDAPTSNVQMVRDAWDRKDAEKKNRSLLNKSKNKIGNLLSKKKNSTEQAATEVSEKRPVGGTIHTAEMKKAERHLITEEEQKPADAQNQTAGAFFMQRQAMPVERKTYNYLGLQTPSGIESFFTSNPVNSAILAVDSLSMGVLSLNQVQTSMGQRNYAPAETSGAQAIQYDDTEGAPMIKPVQMPAGTEMSRNTNAQTRMGMQSGAKRNLIAQQAGTDYMNMVKENRENKKYDVHIV